MFSQDSGKIHIFSWQTKLLLLFVPNSVPNIILFLQIGESHDEKQSVYCMWTGLNSADKWLQEVPCL